MRLFIIVLQLFLISIEQNPPRFQVLKSYYIGEEHIGVVLSINKGADVIKLLFAGDCRDLHKKDKWFAVSGEVKGEGSFGLNLSRLSLEVLADKYIYPTQKGNENLISCELRKDDWLYLILPKSILRKDDSWSLFYLDISNGQAALEKVDLLFNCSTADSLNMKAPLLPQRSGTADW